MVVIQYSVIMRDDQNHPDGRKSRHNLHTINAVAKNRHPSSRKTPGIKELSVSGPADCCCIPNVEISPISFFSC